MYRYEALVSEEAYVKIEHEKCRCEGYEGAGIECRNTVGNAGHRMLSNAVAKISSIVMRWEEDVFFAVVDLVRIGKIGTASTESLTGWPYLFHDLVIRFACGQMLHR